MGRCKIEKKKIEDKKKLQVCFTKRRNGLFKKAKELSVLSGDHIAVVAFSPAGKPFTFSNSLGFETMVDRYLCSSLANQPITDVLQHLEAQESDLMELKKKVMREKMKRQQNSSGSLLKDNQIPMQFEWTDFVMEDPVTNDRISFTESTILRGVEHFLFDGTEASSSPSSMEIGKVTYQCPSSYDGSELQAVTGAFPLSSLPGPEQCPSFYSVTELQGTEQCPSSYNGTELQGTVQCPSSYNGSELQGTDQCPSSYNGTELQGTKQCPSSYNGSELLADSLSSLPSSSGTEQWDDDTSYFLGSLCFEELDDSLFFLDADELLSTFY